MLFSKKLVAFNLFLSSLFALVFAVILEYAFGYHPCTLCIYERWPYFIVLLISVRMLFLDEVTPLFFYLAIAALSAGALITLYHIGIEYHLFIKEESCSITYHNIHEIDSLHKQLISNEIVRCNTPQTVFGIRLTHINLLYSMLSITVTLFIHRRYAS
ncbi:disulfide bond formation protein B [Neorickettsia helminthoeca]|nr:disulfide bond formation protein B [Neorickettsia helminthoeca]